MLVWEAGGPISKRYAASMLWPESNIEHARDCLYKTLAWLRARVELCQSFGLTVVRESISIRLENLSIDMVEFDRCYAGRSDIRLENLSIDMVEFDRCYAGRSDIRCCQRAVELYNGPPFWRDCYDWTIEKQSLYELRYDELLRALSEYHRQHDDSNIEKHVLRQK